MKLRVSWFFIAVLFFSCGRDYREEDITPEAMRKKDSLTVREEKMNDGLEKTNKVMLKKEEDKIRTYAERRGWNVEQRQGVFIQVVEKGGSVSVRDGDEVVLEYECELLNGVKVYDSRRDGLLRIRVGEDSEVPLGLQLAVRHLNLNSLARVIVPYNLAYGLSGDGNRIPKSATLVYTLKVKEIK